MYSHVDPHFAPIGRAHETQFHQEIHRKTILQTVKMINITSKTTKMPSVLFIDSSQNPHALIVVIFRGGLAQFK
jgi:hypothetical protein